MDFQLQATIKPPEPGNFAFCPNAPILAVAQKQLRLFEVPSLTQIAELKGSEHFVVRFAFFPDGKTLASTDGRLIHFWRMPTGTPVGEITVPGLDTFAVSSDGQTIASSCYDTYIRLINVSTGTETLKKKLCNGRLAFSPDGTKLAVVSHAMIIVLDARTFEEQRRLKGHRREIDSLAFSPDGKTLATGAADSSIRLWNVSNGEVIFNLKADKPTVWCVTFSPDGKMLASAGTDRNLKIWNPDNGTILKEISISQKMIGSVGFSHDMKFFAAGTKRELYLWKLV